MTIAVVTHTPEPDVWRYTLGGLARRMAMLPALLPLIYPFASGEAESSGGGAGQPRKLTKPDEIRAFARALGIKPKEVIHGEDR